MKPDTQDRTCTAHKTNGQPCRAKAICGGTVCRVHGGSAPQVRRAAQERLKALVDPAIVALAEIVADPKHPQRLAAAREILERDGRIGEAAKGELAAGMITYEELALIIRKRTVTQEVEG